MNDDPLTKQNASLFLQKVLGFEATEADILAHLYVLAVYYKFNLAVLIPVLEGLITLQQGEDKGKVTVNTGIDKNRRYYTTSVDRILKVTTEPLDVT